ncbi:kinase-like domain-containing protein [Favolaschia claudopus]|uniref:Kinase-like domain-containing protein n=1 Tax=Favolaschia claudopus TaxID=2862362 RepID=A0AAW0DYC2_9AGAR
MPHYALQSSFVPDMTGETIDGGKLLLTESLGAGAFGRVFMARDASSPSSSGSSLSSLRRRSTVYAVKCLVRGDPDSSHAKFQHRERMLHERVSAHPNVVGFHRAFSSSPSTTTTSSSSYDTAAESPALNFLLIDYVPGTNMLAAILDDVYLHNPALIKRTFLAILDAVRFCHKMGAYHRDLKPENVLVDWKGGNPRVMDFGLATDEKTVWEELDCGSGPYMAPEQFSASGSKSYDASRADSWALTIFLVNLLTSMLPWYSAESTDRRWNHFLANAESESESGYLRRLGPVPLSGQLDALLGRCLSVDPKERPGLWEMRKEIRGMRVGGLYAGEKEVIRAGRASGGGVEGIRIGAGRSTVPPPQQTSEHAVQSGMSSIWAREEEIRLGLDDEYDEYGYDAGGDDGFVPNEDDVGGFVPAVRAFDEGEVEDDEELQPPMRPFVHPSPCSSRTDSLSGRDGFGFAPALVRVRVRMALGPSPLSSSLDPEGEQVGGGKRRRLSVSSSASKIKRFMRRMGMWRKGSN